MHLYSVWDGVLVHTDLLCMFKLYYVSRSSVGTSCFALYFQVLLLWVASATRSLENNLIITLSLSSPYPGSLLVHVHRFFNTSDDEIYVDTTSNLALSQDVSHTSRENHILELWDVKRDKGCQGQGWPFMYIYIDTTSNLALYQDVSHTSHANRD